MLVEHIHCGVLYWLLRKELGRFTDWTSVTREIRLEIAHV
jgi:hypothetical protein